MTRTHHLRAINLAQLHNFPHLAAALLELYFRQFPQDRQFNGAGNFGGGIKTDSP